ncbi:MAG: lysophospholipid acyltransferase family protein [Candidatus Sumerlaeia bacterium]
MTRPLRHGLMLKCAEGFRRLVCLLPLSWLPGLGRMAGRVAWACAVGARRLAEEQMLEAGVARDAAEARRLSRRVFESLAMNALEWMHSTGWPDSLFAERVRMDTEPVRRLLAEGRGLICVTGHIGNWEVMFRAARIYHGFTQYVVMAPQRNDAVNRWLVAQRERGGDKMVSSQDGALPIVRLLRRGEMMGMLGDQDSARVSGIFVNFFGRPAYTPAGIGMLAHMCNTPILPTAGYRTTDDNRHVLVYGEPIRPDPALDAAADALRLTQAYTAWLEERIREHPEQWVWIHNRWKRKPGRNDE